MTEFAHGIITVTWGKFNPHVFLLAILADRPIFINGKRYDENVIIQKGDSMVIIEGIDCPYDFDYPNTLDDQFGCRTEIALSEYGSLPNKPNQFKLGLKLDYFHEWWDPVEDLHHPFRKISDVVAEPFEIWEM